MEKPSRRCDGHGFWSLTERAIVCLLIPVLLALILAIVPFQKESHAMPTVQCPKCAASLKAPAKYKGRKVKCKKCGKSFVLRFDGISRPVTADGSTVFDFDLAGPPSKKRVERQPKRRSDKSGQRLSLEAEPWRAAIYQRVTDERFNGNFAAFARIALDTMAEQLGYPVRPSAKANSAD